MVSKREQVWKPVGLVSWPPLHAGDDSRCRDRVRPFSDPLGKRAEHFAYLSLSWLDALDDFARREGADR